MVGITSYGAYVPLYRLKREDIARAWGTVALKGEKAVSNFDEDSITMAVAAVLDCIKGIDRESIDGLYFATTTSPYKEKQAATLIATAADLRRDILTGDFTGSLRSGTTALSAAIDAIKAGSAKKMLVVASDCRLGAPKSSFEQVYGEGSACFLIGDSQPAVEVEGNYSFANEFLDIWRTANDDFVKSWEERFIIEHGYLENVRAAGIAIMKKYELAPEDFDKAVLYGPDARNHLAAARGLGFDPKTQVQDPMFDSLGNTGCAYTLMMLIGALEDAKAGNRILTINYGDGCDAIIFRVTEQIETIRDRHGVKGHLASKQYLPNYERYVSNHQLLHEEPPRRPGNISSAPQMWRDQKWVLSLNGSKCKQCDRLFFPPQRICPYCKSKDEFELIRLSDRKGTLFTFSMDNLAPSLDPPEIFGRVHLDGNVAIRTRMTDRDPAQVKLGMPIEMTFRKYHEGSGFPNYFWKFMPVR